MNEKKNNELSLEALETELRQIPQPAVPVGLEGRLLADIPAAKRTPRTWYRVSLVRAAAAAAILIAVLGLFAWLTGGNGIANLTFAQVMERVEKSQTVVYTVIQKVIGQTETDEQIMRCAYMNPGLLRLDAGTAGIHIIDFQKKKTLVLDPIKKTGRILEIDASSAPLNIIEEMKNFRDGSETILGVREIDGQKAVGFKFHKYDARAGEIEYTVWADVQTNLPIRTEGKVIRSGKTTEVTVTGIEFDVELDKSLFGLEPEGYTIESGTVKMRYETVK